MRVKQLGWAALVTAAAATSFVACSDDDDDDNPVDDIGNTIESVVNDLTDDSGPATTGG